MKTYDLSVSHDKLIGQIYDSSGSPDKMQDGPMISLIPDPDPMDPDPDHDLGIHAHVCV